MNSKEQILSCTVCLFGVDGSGKSTLAQNYQSTVNSKNIKVKIAWIRGTHTISSVLARILPRMESFRGLCNPYYKICIPIKLRFLWLWLEFVSVLPLVFSRFVLPRLRGRVVIAERGLVDFLVWLVVTLRWAGVLKSFVGRVVLSLSRRVCGCLVYVRASVDVLLERRRGYPEAWSIPVQLAIYDRIAAVLGVPVIDTSKSTPAESVRKLIEILGGGCE